MSRLIDADELWEKAKVRVEDNGGLSLPNLYWIIKGLSAVDAVEVVRCEYCSHYDKRWQLCNNPLMKQFSFYSLRMKPDDFCSKGERKTEE